MATILPTSIDSSYADDGSPSRKTHQQHHDAIHAYTNGHDSAADPHGDRAAAAASAAGLYVAQAGGSTITASGPAVKPLTVKLAAAQTASAFEVQNSAGTVLVTVLPNGVTHTTFGRVGPQGATYPGAMLDVLPNALDGKGIVVRGFTGQTASLAEFQDSTGAVTTLVRAGGEVSIIPTNASSGSTPLQTYGANPARLVLVIRGASGQTANLAEFQISTGAAVVAITPTQPGTNGTAINVNVANIGNRQIEVGAADSAGTGFRTVRVAN